ncbi:hypothetical protein [Shinella kummerowiae]|uniref:hypothetical protein n=1 Tax=Shinella kummerowiae TaxID=417745 RepID=UPI0021B585C9|nr:hypothetical protein [Shinella kummerowiae]MCT7668172.1 hypothetical protein [Shinella kummerowiae]
MAKYFDLIFSAIEKLGDKHAVYRDQVYDNVRLSAEAQLKAIQPALPDSYIEQELQEIEGAIIEVESRLSNIDEPTRPALPPHHLDDFWAREFGHLFQAAVPHDEAAALFQAIPEQSLGLSFEIGPNEKLQLARSGEPQLSDQRQLKELHPLLVEAAEDLMVACDRSNAFSFLTKIVSRYRKALGQSVYDASLDQLYVYGVRLETVLNEITSQIEAGDAPSAAPQVLEPLTSLIAVHGPAIMLTGRGKELRQAAWEYSGTPETEEAKEAALEFSFALRSNGEIMERDVADALIDLNGSINQGPDIRRTNQAARSATMNAAAALAKAMLIPVLGGISIVVAQGALEGSEVGKFAIENGTQLIDRGTRLVEAGARFVIQNYPLLTRLAGLFGADLSWLNAFSHLVKRLNPNI